MGMGGGSGCGSIPVDKSVDDRFSEFIGWENLGSGNGLIYEADSGEGVFRVSEVSLDNGGDLFESVAPYLSTLEGSDLFRSLRSNHFLMRRVVESGIIDVVGGLR